MKVNSKVNIVRRIPTLQEFKDLRNDAGWKMPPDSAIQQGLNNTVCGVCADSPDKRTIGMGRIVGDGGIQLFITDIIVHKEWQNQGIGNAIMNSLMKYIEEEVPQYVFVGLFSALNRHTFYEKYGFFTRPNEKFGPGMMLMPEINNMNY